MRKHFTTASRTAHDYIHIAREYFKNGNYADYRHTLLAGIDLFPENAFLWHQLGRHYRSTYRDDQAMECFETAYRLDPADKFIRMDLAKFYVTKMDFVQAEKIYLDFHVEYPDDKKCLTAIGHMYQKSGDFALSRAAFYRALRLDGNDDYTRNRYKEIVHISQRGTDATDLAAFADRIAMVTMRNPLPPAPPRAEP